MQLENVGGVAKYQFTFKALEDIPVPAYKGSLFHGSFGRALLEMAPSWYHFFCPPDSKGIPKPYVLLPPLDNLTLYPKGHTFSCELTLMGEATTHHALCQAALEYLGSRMGLGRKRGRFALESVSAASLSPDRSQPERCFSSGHAIHPEEIVEFRRPLQDNGNVTIQLVTRLRLKHKNQLCRQEPPFALLFSRIAGRLNSLAHFYGGGDILSRPERKHLAHMASNVSQVATDVFWDEWRRFSGRQRSWMKFGGLLGHVTYKGDLGPFVPFLALGEWVHVGGKTSFGLGKYVMEED